MTAAERVEKIKSGSPFGSLDIAFFCAIILLAAVVLTIVYGGRTGSTVEITTPEQKLTYPLDTDRDRKSVV